MTLPLFSSEPPGPPPKKSELRPYQTKSVTTARFHVSHGKTRILLVGPTGSGKGVLVAEIVRTATVVCLYVCDREELVEQCVAQLARKGITNVGVIRGDDDRYNPSAAMQVASIQTLIRRPHLVPAPGLILIDEADLSAAPSYVTHVFEAYPEAVILGFTATPLRHDGKPLGTYWQLLVEIITYQEIFRNPLWLVPPRVFTTPKKIDLSHVRVSMGDFEEGPLGEAMCTPAYIEDAVQRWLDLSDKHPAFTERGDRVPGKYLVGERRRTFTFAVNVRHSKMLAEEFGRKGVKVEHLDAKTPKDSRRNILAALRDGTLEVVCNCEILLVGVDIVPAKCVVGCRPTLSLRIHRQSCGRILRPWNNVTPLLLDQAGNCERHGMPHDDRVWSLTDKPQKKPGAEPEKECPSCHAFVPLRAGICPECGYLFPERERHHTPPVQLEERASDTESMRRATFDKHAATARLKGFKPGYAAAKFKEQYGQWPPYDWSETLRASFEKDEFYQNVKSIRERKKAEREKREIEELKALATAYVPPKEPEERTSGFTQDVAELCAEFDREKEALAALGPAPNEPDPWDLRPDENGWPSLPHDEQQVDVDAQFSDWLKQEGIE